MIILKLYHGSSNTKLKSFDFNHNGYDAFDFGKGIYFTANFEKAKKWSCRSSDVGAVYEIDISFEDLDLKIKNISKDDDDLDYLFYICRVGLSDLAMDFIDDYEQYDVVCGPVLRGVEKGGICEYKALAERFNEGDINFNELRDKTELFSEDFGQICFKSKKAFEYINANLTKKHLVKKYYAINEILL